MVCRGEGTFSVAADDIWKIVMDPDSWARWWGEKLERVDPNWSAGARLVWSDGQGKPVVVTRFNNSALTKELAWDAGGVLVSLSLKEEKDSRTAIRIELDFSRSPYKPANRIESERHITVQVQRLGTKGELAMMRGVADMINRAFDFTTPFNCSSVCLKLLKLPPISIRLLPVLR
jgi:uncharacterized protein YndB with AHSA1/START domain